MVGLRLVSPAAYDDCLALSPPTRYARKVIIRMRSDAETAAIYAGDDLLCVGYLFPLGNDQYEFCFAVDPKAKPHMRRIMRIAHLTLSRVANTNRIVSARVRPGHKPGERMARLTGFMPDLDTPGKWLFSGRTQHGTLFRWRKERQHGDGDGRRPREPGGEPHRAGTPAPAGERSGPAGELVEPPEGTEGPPSL